mmetsp:Transcript_23226/g.28795  ORF Transcript_23226/g.28795 Transcript_23226/m.28795 type:complete len:122 (+) Transcript_23226:453-818(+)|eukprot:CAMPEP_0170474004 /NCGR_PEP_ID=MMETSP0123-20130129/15839_1 /TAXON_ID=182087 /ORGANISM="Favella ehrenbergii, Strain Fehren 1" /LENGTH=121 /DNA_ID=CAMNT_0010743449 /DNA_START=502 /DNA_END=867 /DNA_ORIENTATION=-
MIGYSLMGLMMAKNTLTFTWAFELVTKKHKSCASTCLLVLDFSVSIIAGLFFLSISREWKLLMYPFFAAGALGYIIVTLMVPESPQWLLLQGRKAEAIESLNYIAKVNRSNNRISQDVNFV